MFKNIPIKITQTLVDIEKSTNFAFIYSEKLLKTLRMSVNKVILIGNVGKDPDVRYFDDGSARANFPLATSERGYTMANGTVVPERTEWHNIVCWRGLAQVIEKYVRKGDPLYIEGKLRTRSYDDQNGVKKYITEISAENIEFLARKGSSTPTSTGGVEDKVSTEADPSGSDKTTPTTNSDISQVDSSEEIDDLPF